MDLSRTPLVECFERGEVPRDVRLLAARGALALRVPEQIALLILLVSDPDPAVAARAEGTIARLPRNSLDEFLAGPDVPEEVRHFFAGRPAGTTGAAAVEALNEADGAEDALDAEAEDDPAAAAAETRAEIPAEPGGDAQPAGEQDPVAVDSLTEHAGAARRLSLMTVAGRIKAAIQGTREERNILIRDPNRVVTSAVLSSPKLSEGDVETIARMTNVSDDVLRQIAANRSWIRNYAVMAALARNAKTPIGVTLALLPRLTERDVKMLAADRNIPEPVRLTARKLNLRSTSRRQ